MRKVEVQVCSFGQKWGIYPNGPDAETLQFVVDVRATLPDSFDEGFRIDGTRKEVQDWILDQKRVRGWLKRQVEVVLAWTREARKGGFKRVKVYFMCTGGFQRSVFTAETVAAGLRANATLYILTILPVVHLTKDLSATVNAAGAQAPKSAPNTP